MMGIGNAVRTLEGTLYEDGNVTIRKMNPGGALVVGKLDGCIPEVTESFQSYELALEAYARLLSRRLAKASENGARQAALATKEAQSYRQQLQTALEMVETYRKAQNTGPLETRSLLVMVEDLRERLAAVERQLGTHEGA
jgi:hypothetical protein